MRRLDDLALAGASCRPSRARPTWRHGWRPPARRPSPPPIGWATGFSAEPRTVGRRPMWRLRPALPSTTRLCVDVADLADRRAAVEVDLAHLAATAAVTSAVVALARRELRDRRRRERTSWPPRPGVSSTLWICEADRDVREREAVAELRLAPCWPVITTVPTCERRAARGCSASRRPRSGAARCARCGSGRTRSRATLRRDAVLVALEVDHAVHALVAAAAVAHASRGRGCCGRPCLRAPAQQRLLGRLLREVSVKIRIPCRRVGPGVSA